MENENKKILKTANEQAMPQNTFKYVVGVGFQNALHMYYFGTNDDTLKKGENVVVETTRGQEMGFINTDLKQVNEISLELELKPVIRKATEEDKKKYADNEQLAKKAAVICQESIQQLNLPMNLISSEYILDTTKVIFTYVSDDRVDFRELLKVLAQKLHCRIELRQIGARDRSKSIGGLGPCGLPLCCHTFLSDFEGISINMAKNQLLALNIQKLSGQCGKLVCCLKYEDDYYTKLKEGLPKLGQRVMYNDQEYKVTSLNVLSRTIKLDNKEESLFLSLDDFLNQNKKA